MDIIRFYEWFPSCTCCWEPLEGDVALRKNYSNWRNLSWWRWVMLWILTHSLKHKVISHITFMKTHYYVSIQTHTCGVCSLEALPLYWGVRNEAEVHLVAGGDQLLRDLTATQSTQDGCRVTVPVEGLQVVIRTFLVLLDLKLVEGLSR